MSLLRTSEINRRNAKLSVLRIVQARVEDEPDLFRILHPFLATFLLDREAGVQASGLNCATPSSVLPAAQLLVSRFPRCGMCGSTGRS